MTTPAKEYRCSYAFCAVATKFYYDTRKLDRTVILSKRSPTLDMEGTVSGKLLGIVAAVALLASIGAASAKDPVKLTDGQLDKVTAGASVTQVPIAASLLANGAGGAGGINQFSPSTATVTQTNSAVGFNLFTIH